MFRRPRAPCRVAILALVFSVLAARAGAAEEKPTEVSSPREARLGKTVLVKPESGSVYFLHVPRSYKARKRARVIVFLHGSNMNGLQYLRTILGQGWCRDDILVCPNGEKGSDPYRANNFTFASAKLIAAITREVQETFNVTRTYLGGHSQGAFVTYSALMHYPELYQGAFPMAGDCWSQNEPNLWETQSEVLEKQRQIAIAVIHGKNDGIVSFSQGEHAYGVFVAMAYPRLRFFAPERLGHQFGLAPVPEALAWLDAMVGDDDSGRLRLAAQWIKEDQWGWVVQVAKGVIVSEKSSRRAKKQARAALQRAEKEAAAATKRMRSRMNDSSAAEWLPEWYEFRQQFGGTEAAAPLVAKFDSRRTKQSQAGRDLFNRAAAEYRGENKSAGNKLLRELLEKAPCSYHAYCAISWLEESNDAE